MKTTDFAHMTDKELNEVDLTGQPKEVLDAYFAERGRRIKPLPIGPVGSRRGLR